MYVLAQASPAPEQPIQIVVKPSGTLATSAARAEPRTIRVLLQPTKAVAGVTRIQASTSRKLASEDGTGQAVASRWTRSRATSDARAFQAAIPCLARSLSLARPPAAYALLVLATRPGPGLVQVVNPDNRSTKFDPSTEDESPNHPISLEKRAWRRKAGRTSYDPAHKDVS